MRMMIEPPDDLIGIWMDAYVPDKDLFFLREKDLVDLEKHLNNVLLIPKKEFFHHSSYTQIQLVNSFEYWKLSSEVQYVLVANPDWLGTLSQEVQQWINDIQLEVMRGLIFPKTLVSSRYLFPKENMVKDDEEEYVVLQSELWSKLPYEVKENILKEYAKNWDDWNCYEMPEEAPSHLRKYANTFPAIGGGNCLAATLFAVSKQEWIVNEWVHPETFAEGLKRANYFAIVSEEILNHDVVVWVDENGVVQHASYHISENLFFNKDGQTFFNPWKVVDWRELNQEWGSYTYRIYRKRNST